MKKRVRSILAMAVALALALTTLLSGCGGGTTPGGTTGGGATVKDTITFAQGSDPRGLDPALCDDGESLKVMCNIYEGLLGYADDSTEIVPVLAESWDISEDGLAYTFKLRENVKFQDGTAFDAEAVKFNIERQIPPLVTEEMGYAGFVYGSVKDVVVNSTYSVTVNLTEPNSAFLANVAMGLAAPMVSPTALQAGDNSVIDNPVGTGPYKFVRWNRGESLVLVANPDYWGTQPKVQNIVFRFIADNSARVVALNSGEVDIIDGIDASLVDQIKSGGDLVAEVQGMNINYMAFNASNGVFANKDARVAAAQAINVPELVQALYQGYAEPATTILPTFVPGYDSAVKQVAYDEAAAKTGLAAAGVTTVHVITYSNPRPYNPATGSNLATAIQGYFQKVGVECVIDTYDWTTYKDKIRAGDYDICFYGWTGDNGDPDNFRSLLSDPDPTMNVSRWADPVYINGMAEALATPSGPERYAQYGELESYAAENAIWVPLSHGKVLVGVKPGLTGYVYHVTGNLHFAKASFTG
ncbi:MAG: ABC transporter substrate-binding protein [Coriobacteriales bacterium]|jgi:peptide/nickel transport system substrate-binding protein|nr:ABC transporter substrate-binding protein [Coriobacteriales bacterium]